MKCNCGNELIELDIKKKKYFCQRCAKDYFIVTLIKDNGKRKDYLIPEEGMVELKSFLEKEGV